MLYLFYSIVYVVQCGCMCMGYNVIYVYVGYVCEIVILRLLS